MRNTLQAKTNYRRKKVQAKKKTRIKRAFLFGSDGLISYQNVSRHLTTNLPYP
jgi:hypothetical protein